MSIMIIGELALADGLVALVDKEDWARLSQFKWTAMVRPSGNIHVHRKEGNKTIWLHHEVMQIKPVVFDVDHINRDGLDNRKANLRLVTRRDNMLNTKRSQNARLYEKTREQV